MATIIDFRPRTLERVLLDIVAADRAFKASWGEENESERLDELDALRDEAREMVERLTGCSWDDLSGAGL